MKRAELQQALAAGNLSLNGTVPVLKERLTEALARADRSDVGHRDESAVKLDKPLKRPSVVRSLGTGFLLVCDDQAKEVICIPLTFDGHGISGETHTLCMYPVGCVRASDMSAAQDVLYFCFSGENNGIYKLNTNDDASLTSVFLNSQECTVVGTYADKESLYFNDACSRKVKRLDVLTKDISIIAGCGSAGLSDGKASESSFTQLWAIWGEGEVLFVTDAATGSVHMITPPGGTVAFLRNLGLLFDSFGVHLKGQKPPAVTIRDAVSTLSNIVQFVEDCSMQVQKITRKKSPTNGLEGTISHRTQTSTVMILHGLTRLESLLHDINPAFGQEVGLQPCMTSVVENLHAVTKMKYPTPTVLDHTGSFGNAMHDTIKRMCAWSVKYYTHLASYYPVPAVAMKLSDFNQKPLKAHHMTADDMTFMREWAREHGQPVRQMSVRQLSTMDKPGTLPISAYRTPLAVEPVEYLDEEEPPRQAEVEGEAAEVSSSEVEDDVTDNEYDSESEESDSEEEAAEQERVETSTVPTYSYYQYSQSGRAIRPVSDLICESVVTLLSMKTMNSQDSLQYTVRLLRDL